MENRNYKKRENTYGKKVCMIVLAFCLLFTYAFIPKAAVASSIEETEIVEQEIVGEDTAGETAENDSEETDTEESGSSDLADTEEEEIAVTAIEISNHEEELVVGETMTLSIVPVTKSETWDFL